MSLDYRTAHKTDVYKEINFHSDSSAAVDDKPD